MMSLVKRIACVCSSTILLGLFVSPSLLAAPVFNKETTLVQPDDTKVPVIVSGDEYYQHVESLDGYTLCRNEEGWICYATLNEEASEYVATDVIYNGNTKDVEVKAKRKLRTKGAVLDQLTPHIKLDESYIEQKREEVKAELHVEEDNGIALASIPATASYSLNTASTAETVKGLTLLIDFPDTSSSVTKEQIDNFFNEEGYSEFNNNGSVRDYFYDVSGGMLTYENEVVGFYTAKHNKSYYDSASVTDYSTALELVEEALEWLKSTGFDFSNLTVNERGVVKGVNILYAGTADAGWSNGLWPHKGWIPNAISIGNGHYIQDYELSDIGTRLQLDTICHENGHLICNYPDLYDYDGDSQGTGGYSLMSGCIDTGNPFPPDPYCRNIISGWHTTYDLNSFANQSTIVAESSLGGDHPVYKWSGNDSNEYFLIENINKTGRYAAMPARGLMIWHVDEDGNNAYNEMTSDRHYMVSLEQADGLFELENNSSYGDARDAFSTATQTSFNDTTVPNANWWDGSYSNLSIGNISAPGETMTFVKSPDGAISTPDEDDMPSVDEPIINDTTNVAPLAEASTSYCSSWETVDALNDDVIPSSSSDTTAGAYGNWPETSTQWVQYTFDEAYTLSATDVYWFKDNGGIDVPESYRVQYLDANNNWVDVSHATGLGTNTDTFNTTTFTPVSTTAIRLSIEANDPYSTGILEWKVYGAPTSLLETEAVNISDLAQASTSYCSSWETITALNDAAEPSSSADKSAGAYGNWPETSEQWVQYTFNEKHTISSTDIYWFKDNGGIDVPSSYVVQYLDDNNNWVNVLNATGLGTATDTYNTTSFIPVTTSAMRVLMKANGTYSTGILEWKVYGTRS